ncbi:hypothetical protein P43SY_011820 [Pythium insidiosum]|uniref:Uncharacterized protein n=1 Tax=Pythium insidiosum TaxID=114742 RepID=A0AAD5L5G5_PYTIN|nr:hypothetical protein P43SY_011820 [Pythium insidiosum]
MTYLVSTLPDDNNAAVSVGVQRLLGPVSSFADFLRLNPRVLERLETSMAPQSEPINKRSTEEFLETLAKLLNHGALNVSMQEAPRQEMLLLLKENAELRGFLPLQGLWADAPASAKWRDDLSASNGQSHSPTNGNAPSLI